MAVTQSTTEQGNPIHRLSCILSECRVILRGPISRMYISMYVGLTVFPYNITSAVHTFHSRLHTCKFLITVCKLQIYTNLLSYTQFIKEKNILPEQKEFDCCQCYHGNTAQQDNSIIKKV